jgi:glycosyltransferase involved in cell wall biosynthesis
MFVSAHVVPHIDNEAAGPSYSVPRLCQALAGHGNKIQLHCLKGASIEWDEIEIIEHKDSPFLKKLGFSNSMKHALKAGANDFDIIHNHSLWMMPNIYPAWAIRGSKARLITAPRGTLTPWALKRSRYAKSLLWHWQKEALEKADCLHATAESEYVDIRNKGLTAPVLILPNGIDIPTLEQRPTDNGLRKLLFLGRIHPKKGIDLLLRSWKMLAPRFPDWELLVAGPDNGGYMKTMIGLKNELELSRVSFLGPVFGQEKTKIYQSSDLFVLPTHSENFGLTVAEALANNVPAIVTKGAPWEGLNLNGCGWWIEHNESKLYDILFQAMTMTRHELQKMGDRGRNWMANEYSWEEIGRKLSETYKWLLGGGESPVWVKHK